MPLSGEHDAPLSLAPGEDGFLTWLGRALALGALAVVVSGPLPAGARLLLSMAIVAYLLAIERLSRRDMPQHLVLHPNGRSIRTGTHGSRQGVLLRHAWISRYYCFLHLNEEDRRRIVVISASRQDRGEYRKLLAWIRLQRCNSP